MKTRMDKIFCALVNEKKMRFVITHSTALAPQTKFSSVKIKDCQPHACSFYLKKMRKYQSKTKKKHTHQNNSLKPLEETRTFACSMRILGAHNYERRHNTRKKDSHWIVVTVTLLLPSPLLLLLSSSLLLNNSSALSFLVQVSHFSFVNLIIFLVHVHSMQIYGVSAVQWRNYVHVFGSLTPFFQMLVYLARWTSECVHFPTVSSSNNNNEGCKRHIPILLQRFKKNALASKEYSQRIHSTIGGSNV